MNIYHNNHCIGFETYHLHQLVASVISLATRFLCSASKSYPALILLLLAPEPDSLRWIPVRIRDENTVDDLICYEKSTGMGLGIPPKGKHIFGLVKVGEKGQIVIPAKARTIFHIKPGDNLIVIGDEGQGIALLKEENLLELLHIAGSEK